MVSAILSDMRDLALSEDVSDELRLLKSLSHWVGDIHQPLHVAFQDDKGGNAIDVTGACSRNLHAVWDTCIIDQEIGDDYEAIATDLREEMTDEERKSLVRASVDTASVISWANESFAIATSPEVQYCIETKEGCSEADRLFQGRRRVVTIDDEYLSRNALTVWERLKAAGIRLGAILNTIFGAHSG